MTQQLKSFISQVRERLEKANPENRIFTDYTDNRRDLALAIESLENYQAAIQRIFHNSAYSMNKAQTVRDRQVFKIIFNDANRCQKEVAEILTRGESK